ncbi:HEAT repeat domain-containing protein [Dyadobacter sp. BHUBP1]|uniref:HEAT repeat domain-containing protein n=1 Tax=Dyadobacter sp. BHUBP1 TaxID=3424178 RepID=UPI003D329205
MTVISRLATSLGRRDEVPNQELAIEIATNGDGSAIADLIENLSHKSKDVRHDCIKVLYEIGERMPPLIAAYADQFAALLGSKDNRMQWGAMTALNAIAREKPEVVFAAVPQLAAVADKGSVITRDNFVAILIKLSGIPAYADQTLPLLNEQMLSCPSNQLPMYAENALPVISAAHKAIFVKTLTSRLGDFEKESKRKRMEKVLKRLG